jgi:hypothetical protein
MNSEKTEHYKKVCKAVISKIASNSRRINPVYEKVDEIFFHYENIEKLYTGICPIEILLQK